MSLIQCRFNSDQLLVENTRQQCCSHHCVLNNSRRDQPPWCRFVYLSRMFDLPLILCQGAYGEAEFIFACVYMHVN
jgi:hypothetical protein